MKALISIPEFDDLSSEAKDYYNDQLSKHGRVTNMKNTLLHSPPSFVALMSWYPLFEELEKFISHQAALFYAQAISNENKCLICNTFFVKILKDLNINFKNFSFNETESLLIDYGQALVNNPHQISASIYERLSARFSQAQIVALTAFASLMIATNLINTALKIPLDEYLFEHLTKTNGD